MFCLTCTILSSVDSANYGVSCAEDWVSVDCGTICVISRRKHRIVLTPHKNRLSDTDLMSAYIIYFLWKILNLSLN